MQPKIKLGFRATGGLLKQLLVIQSVLRTAPVMHGVVKNLSRDQMTAIVAYL